MYISDVAFKSWTGGSMTHVEELLTEEIDHPSNPFHHARALAHRALVRMRLKQWDTAVDDVKKVYLCHLWSCAHADYRTQSLSRFSHR